MNELTFEHTLLHTLADNVPHRIYAKDLEGRFTFANKGVAQGMGVEKPEGLIGRTDFDFYPEADAALYFSREQEIYRTGVPMLDFEEHVEYLHSEEDRWLITSKLPLHDEQGRIIGLVGINYDITAQKRAEAALRVANEKNEATARKLQETVKKLSQEMSERRRFEKELRRQALHDGLTGLPNRTLLMDRLGNAIDLAERHHHSLTLLFIDLDRFKIINDSLGHAFGDELLKTISRRVSRCIRRSDTFARLGGDEFVLLLPNAIPDDVLQRLTERLTQVITEPVTLGSQQVSVSCSMGCSFYPKDGLDPTTLLQSADAAMYQAKEQGGSRACYYTAGLKLHLNERLETEMQLRQALERNEFLLHYQPQVALETGEIVGVEALIRWQQSERGLISPAQFIPIAEETGLIGAIGEWVLRTACLQAASWNRAGLPPLRMSVNLSARQLLAPELERVVRSALTESGLPAEQLELELTESASMTNPEETIRVFTHFNRMGIKLSIDDFGTGYSNLSYLRHFPVHRVKLDRSFVSVLTEDQSSHAIVEAIVALAHKLELDIVAEGVETEAQRDQLMTYGCDYMQGFWFARPMDAKACEALLRDHFGRARPR